MSQRGLLECLRYCLPPNVLAYCGPAQTQNFLDYCRAERVDDWLVSQLSQFQTLYAYLSFIAQANRIGDPFDLRVVQAYWLGNELLVNFDPQRFYYHLRDTLKLKQHLTRQELETLFGKIPQGALPHHAFHVFNVPWRTGHLPIEHTIETMDACRISWGQVVQNEKGKIGIENLPLVYENGLLKLGQPIQRMIASNIRGTIRIDVKVGQWVTFHWGMLCNKISLREAQSLQYYTQLAINLANADIRRR